MAQEDFNFYQEQFMGKHTDMELTMLDHILNMVSEEINDFINAHPILKEVKTVVFELNGKNACGPNGF